jgi:hypothetical protein
MLFGLADRRVLILEGRELRFHLKRLLASSLTEKASHCSPTARGHRLGPVRGWGALRFPPRFPPSHKTVAQSPKNSWLPFPLTVPSCFPHGPRLS